MTVLEQFIAHNQSWLPHAKHCLVAVSGGSDSMALLHLCLQTKMKLSVAHMNFQLRNDESMRDEGFVRATCEALSIPCYVKQVDTKLFVEEHQIGTQEAARILRYNYFAELHHQHQFDFVLTAHHASDNIETVLMNLIRGTGSVGITGIPKHRSFYIRPLLHIAKADISSYIHEQGISFVEDSSNLTDDYTRNSVRHHLLSKIDSISTNGLSNFASSLKRINEEQSIYKATFQAWVNAHQHRTENGFSFRIADLNSLPHAATALRLVLANEQVYTRELEKLMDAETGAVMELTQHRILKNREELVIENKTNLMVQNEFYIEESNGKFADFETRMFDRTDDTSIDKNRYVAMLDLDKLQFPLMVRKWQAGDTFYPFGMKNKKLVSDFLINEKVNVFDKERVMVVCSKNEIVWVAGYRIDNRFALSENSKRIFEIRKC